MKTYPYTGGTSNRTSYVDEIVNFPLKLKWKTKMGKTTGNPVFSEGKLYSTIPLDISIGTPLAFALDANDGRILWNISPQGLEYINGFACLHRSMVFFSGHRSGKHELMAVNCIDGQMLWNQEGINGEGLLVYRNKLIVNTRAIYSIDPQSRKILWDYKPEYAACNPSVYDGRAVFGDSPPQTMGGNLYCLDADTGESIWKRDVSKLGEYRVERVDKVEIKPGWFASRYPVIAEGKIYGSLGAHMCCFNIETGELIWKEEGAKTPIYKDGRLYSFVLCQLFCYDAKTGKIIYKKEYPEIGTFSQSLPFLAGNTFFQGTEQGLFAFDINSGEKVWEFHSKKKYAPFRSQPVFIDGRLYVGCDDGYMYCFESRKG